MSTKNQLDSALAALGLTPEQEDRVRAYVASKTKRYAVNSNKVTAALTLGDGTQLTLGIGKKLGNIRVYGLRNRLPIALPVARWEQIFEAEPMIRDFVAKHSEHLTGAPNVAEDDVKPTSRKRSRKS